MQSFQLSIFRQLEYSPTTTRRIATTRRNSVEIAGAVADQAADGNSTVGLAGEAVENGFFSLGSQFKHDSPVIGWAAELGRTVKVALGVADETSVGIASIVKVEGEDHLKSAGKRAGCSEKRDEQNRESKFHGYPFLIPF